MDGLALCRLLQLASPGLPVGAFSYSQGLEYAVEAGWVHDKTSAEHWITDVLEQAVARHEAPLLAHLLAAWQAADMTAVLRLNAEFLASRDTAELRAETVQMGYSLRQLIPELTSAPAMEATLDACGEPAFPTVWAALANLWALPAAGALHAYLWSWAENQVLAAIKAVPLGQAAGQRLLFALGQRIPALAATAVTLAEEEWNSLLPGLALASARHETQYSRLFRS